MYRIDKLLKQEEKLFHTRDLAILWGMTNNNTIYTTIKRYVKKGILIRIHKGYYSTVPIENLNPISLGIGYLHDYVYVSGEYILSQNGIIFQNSPYITLISSRSVKFNLGKFQYWTRRLKEKFLYNESGMIKKEGIKTATVERAVADILYFNPSFHLDNKRIDWEKVRQIQKEVGYK